MGEDSSIAWCDHTFNPWIGCQKVSPGCAYCYAETWSQFSGLVRWGGPRERTKGWTAPARWQENYDRDVRKKGPRARPKVFCASLADWLDDAVPIEWLADLLQTIHETDRLDWLLLSKRPSNIIRLQYAWELLNEAGPARAAAAAWVKRWIVGHPPSNVWIGVSVEDNERARERIPVLCGIPARVRFLSIEPLLEDIDLSYAFFDGSESYGSMAGIQWAIIGGESGKKARPMKIEWVRSLLSQLSVAGVSPFVKQVGHRPTLDGSPYQIADAKGGLMDEWPKDIRVREFPSAV